MRAVCNSTGPFLRDSDCFLTFEETGESFKWKKIKGRQMCEFKSSSLQM